MVIGFCGYWWYCRPSLFKRFFPQYNLTDILDWDKGNLFYKTICMDSKQHWGDHYAVHSLYGHAESIVTYK